MSSLLFSTILEVLARAIKQEKEIKDIQIGNEEVKLSILQMIWFFIGKTPKTPPKKLLETINKYSKVAGYKINVKKSIAFLQTNNKMSEKEIKSNPFVIATKE